MYKYKGVRYFFRILNLIVYSIVISFIFLVVVNKFDIIDMLNSFLSNYEMTPKRSFYLAVFLLLNVAFILLFRLISKKEIEAILYYICDFVIRITFSIPVSIIVFYFLVYRFCEALLVTTLMQGIIFAMLFFIFDSLMKMQIRYQLKVNYFRVNDKV